MYDLVNYILVNNFYLVVNSSLKMLKLRNKAYTDFKLSLAK